MDDRCAGASPWDEGTARLRDGVDDLGHALCPLRVYGVAHQAVALQAGAHYSPVGVPEQIRGVVRVHPTAHQEQPVRYGLPGQPHIAGRGG